MESEKNCMDSELKRTKRSDVLASQMSSYPILPISYMLGNFNSCDMVQWWSKNGQTWLLCPRGASTSLHGQSIRHVSLEWEEAWHTSCLDCACNLPLQIMKLERSFQHQGGVNIRGYVCWSFLRFSNPVCDCIACFYLFNWDFFLWWAHLFIVEEWKHLPYWEASRPSSQAYCLAYVQGDFPFWMSQMFRSRAQIN